MGVDAVNRNGTGVASSVWTAPVLVGGAGSGAGPSGCCTGVVAGAALGQRLAWEGGTPLSCSSSFILGVDEVK